MRVGLLGDLEVRDGDRLISIPMGKQQALLVLLALHAGRVVPAEQVVDALWGENPPPRVRNGLQALASKLRSALGAADLVVMRGGGYMLDVAAEAVDVHLYESLVAAGRAAAVDDPRRAVALLMEADSLWRGDVLADFAYEDFVQPTINRLSELRLSSIEERIELELTLGRLSDGIAELEALVAAHPLRERLRGQLMIALYRAGRQADALRVFQTGRHILGNDLGLEPGPELRRVEAAILAQDVALDVVAAPSERPVTASRRGAIPEALTPLVGRDDALREIGRMVAEHRLVSLVGPGGVGKTRLAAEVARVRSETMSDGGYLVELAPVGDPSAVRAAIASALDLPDPTRVAETIGDRELIVVLDNCEHVIEAAAAVAEDLLRRCPMLQLVATSRETLRVGGEMVWPVPPLATADAVQLFLARAAAAGAHLEDSADLVSRVGDVCARLDGLPLAIELAAARTRALGMHEISSRLNDRFRLLTGGSRTVLPRQQTLRAVVDWSYELLFDAEQRVFERLSVFPGGCDLATAEAICADDMLVPDDIADVVQALVDKSLVVADRTGDRVRFTQLQTLAQYGQEKLAARGDARRVREVMAAHFADLCAQSKVAYTGDIQRAWLVAMNEEQDNLRAALEWALANDDSETALVIAGGSSWPHWLAGTATEGMRWVDDAFACRGEVSDLTQALALTGRGLLSLLAGRIAAADADLSAAVEIFRSRDDVDGMVLAYSFFVETARLAGDVEVARRRRGEVLELYRSLPDSTFVCAGRAYSEAMLALLDGDVAAAEAHYRDAEKGFAVCDRPVMRAITLGVLADFDERAGRHRAATTELAEAIHLAETAGMRGFVGSLYSRLAWSQLQEGQISRAEVMIQRALDAGRRLRSPHILFLAHACAAVLHRLSGRNQDAVDHATESLRIHATGGPSRVRNRIDPDFEIASVLAVCCSVLAVVAIDGGDATKGAQLLGHAALLREQVDAPVASFHRGDLQEAQATAAAALGPDAFAAAYQDGRRRGPCELAGIVD